MEQSLASDNASKERITDEKSAKVQEKISTRNLKATMKKLDAECKLFQDMSQNSFRDAESDSAAFGLNRLEYQAAKVIAITTVKESYERGQITADNIQRQVHKAIRKVAGDESFRNWVKEASDTPGKMETLGKMPPEHVKADFVNSLAKEMMRQNGEPKRDGPKTENSRIKNRRIIQHRKEPPKIKDPVKEGP